MGGFKAFLFRGNVVELAVGIVIGAVFVSVVTAFVKDILTPLIGAFGGQSDFSSLTITVNNSRLLYGDFINSLISFIIIAAVVYFIIVVPYTKLMERLRREPPADPTTRKCPECLSVVPIAAKRCAFCASQIA